jgi:hypothetical protein
MTEGRVAAEMADDLDEIWLLDREPARVLRRMTIEEASKLHTDLGVELDRYRRRKPGKLPSHAGGYAIGAPRCRGRDGACTNRSLPGLNYCAACEPH